MNFGLKTYLAEETKRYDVVLVKKKIYLKERTTGKGESTEWTLQNSGFGQPLDTLFADQVLVGMRVERGRLRYIHRVSRKTGDYKQEYADFNPSEFDELVKLGALKGLA